MSAGNLASSLASLGLIHRYLHVTLYPRLYVSYVTRHFTSSIGFKESIHIYISMSQHQFSPITSPLLAFNEQDQTYSTHPVIQSQNNPIVRLSGYYERHPFFAPSGIPCSRSFLIHLSVCPIAGRLLSISVL